MPPLRMPPALLGDPPAADRDPVDCGLPHDLEHPHRGALPHGKKVPARTVYRQVVGGSVVRHRERVTEGDGLRPRWEGEVDGVGLPVGVGLLYCPAQRAVVGVWRAAAGYRDAVLGGVHGEGRGPRRGGEGHRREGRRRHERQPADNRPSHFFASSSSDRKGAERRRRCPDRPFSMLFIAFASSRLLSCS